MDTVNEVTLVGRVSAAAEERVLPSGDVVVTWRLVLPRATRDRAPGMKTTVDTITCAAWRAPLRRAALRWAPGDVVQVEGALRSRYWRVGAGNASRVEVEVSAAERIQKAGVAEKSA